MRQLYSAWRGGVVRSGLHHCIESDEKLAGGRDDGLLLGLSGGKEALLEGVESRVPARGLQGGDIDQEARRRPAAVDAARASLLTTVAGPTSEAISRRSSLPSSGRSARRVAATTGPTPGAVRRRRSSSASSGTAAIRAAISASKTAISRSRPRMWRLIERRAKASSVCWSRVASCLRVSTNCRRRVARAWSARRSGEAGTAGARSSLRPISARSLASTWSVLASRPVVSATGSPYAAMLDVFRQRQGMSSSMRDFG
jgi:hypothetical protein